MKPHLLAVAAFCLAAVGWAYEPPAHTNSFVRKGVTYAQRGGMNATTYVVTNIDMTASDVGAVDTNEVRDIIRDEITPATNSLHTTLNDSIGAKRDKDDLAVYEVVRTENTDWTWTTNVVDRLATTNGVAAAISANEKTGTNEQVVRGELWQDSTWLIQVENADFARQAVADEEGYNIMDTYATKSEVDDKADRATTLSGYGITDGATKTEVVPLWVAGHVYNAGDTVLYNGAYYRAMFDDTSSSADKTFSYWEPITFENVDVYGGLSVHTGDLSVDNGDLELSGGGITVNSGFEIKRGINKVVYGISVNGGAAQHGDVSIDIPAPGNYAAVSNAAMNAVQPNDAVSTLTNDVGYLKKSEVDLVNPIAEFYDATRQMTWRLDAVDFELKLYAVTNVDATAFNQVNNVLTDTVTTNKTRLVVTDGEMMFFHQ